MAEVQLIPMDELATLKAASEVKAIADSAAYLQELQSVAHAINSAANCGQHTIRWSRQLSQAVKDELISEGYLLYEISHTAERGEAWTIGGF